MIVYRPYIQTNLFQVSLGILAPLFCSWAFVFLLRTGDFPGRIYYLLSCPFVVVGGLYFLFSRCVWVLICDDEKGLLYFYKTTKMVLFRVRELKELYVFKSFRGFDFRFRTKAREITIEEMDGMHELVTYIRRINPQIDVTSPEDHKLF